MSFVNLNSNIIAAVEILTTGEKANRDDLVGICVLPLDNDLRIRRDIIPFYMQMQPRRPYNVDENRLKISKADYVNLILKSFDPDTAADLFDDWYKKLKMKENKGIIPLSHDWASKREFVLDWLGPINYYYHFVDKTRDIQTVALYENDLAEHNCEPIPYAKTNFTYIAKVLGVEFTRLRFDTLDRCIASAECYRKMVKQSPFSKGISR